MNNLHKHRNPQTLKACGDAIVAAIEAVPSLRYAADTLRANGYPLNHMVDVRAAGELLVMAADKADTILAQAREEARQQAKG